MGRKLEVLNDRVLVQKLREEKTKSGILLPSSDKEIEWGLVKALPEESHLKVGDRVAFFSYHADLYEDDLYVVETENLLLREI